MTTQQTLPDFIDHNLCCLSIGLNPSILSAQRGYYFANPRNRFWRAFNQAGIVDRAIEPSMQAHLELLNEQKLGFTDVVKRPSKMGHELRASDFKQDAPNLRNKVEKYSPQLLWIHGKVAAQKFFQYAYGFKGELKWGANKLDDLGPINIYISPNPSPANAVFSLEELVNYYQKIIL